MIVAARPHLKQVVRDVWRTLAFLLLWDIVVTSVWWVLPFKAPAIPLALLGSGVALFLGVRDSAAYQRWWEGRVLWGAMVNASRSLARAAVSMPGPEAEGRRLAERLIRRQIAYVHALKDSLRGRDPRADVMRLAPDQPEAEAALACANPANVLLTRTGEDVARARRDGLLDTVQQTQIERVLVDVSNAQGGMERLKRTPLPMQYRFFPGLFTHLFCVLLPIGTVETLGLATPVGSTAVALTFLAVLRIADELTDPFAGTRHDTPLDALCRTIEIDLLQTLGEPAPEPVRPVDGVLW